MAANRLKARSLLSCAPYCTNTFHYIIHYFMQQHYVSRQISSPFTRPFQGLSTAQRKHQRAQLKVRH